MNIEQKFALSNNRPTGFDYMRLILALSVLWLHTAKVSYGADHFISQTPFRPFFKAILPMFFALSGFLVAASLSRAATLISFLGNRVIRIYPALAVEVVLSAFVIGPIFTKVGLTSYFTDKKFFIYLLNVTGDIHYYLPGVFLSNPMPGMVNLQLWTVPFELGCYVGISALFLLGVSKRRLLAPVSAVLFIIVSLIYRHIKYGDKFLYFPNVVPGIVLIAAFMGGVTIYLYRDKILWDGRIFFASLIFTLFAFWFTGVGDIISIPALAYITVYLGVMNPRKLVILRGADYSYGVYLYGFVIQQAFASLGPWTRHWYLNGLVCSLLAISFAAFSWHFVEKPSLNLRKYVMLLESTFLARNRKALPATTSA